jgi:hypothetical protein
MLLPATPTSSPLRSSSAANSASSRRQATAGPEANRAFILPIHRLSR